MGVARPALLIVLTTILTLSGYRAHAQSMMEPDASLLHAYHWQLVDARSSDGARLSDYFEGKDSLSRPLRMELNSGYLSTYAGCNTIGSSFKFVGGQMQTSLLTSTAIGCLSKTDDAMLAFLKGNPKLEIVSRAPPRIDLVAFDGRRLTFAGDPTDATKYGSEGEPIHFEVARHTLRCSVADLPPKDCLQVRPLSYGKGMAESIDGPWEPFYPDIQNFTHRDSVAMKVVVMRYAVKSAATGGNAFVYVLKGVYEMDDLPAHGAKEPHAIQVRSRRDNSGPTDVGRPPQSPKQ